MTLTATLTVTLTLVLADIVGTFGVVNPARDRCSLTIDATSAAVSFDCFETTATLTSAKNGHVTGTLTFPGDLQGVMIENNFVCAQVSWTLITLTFGSQSVALPDVSGQFDSTGSFVPSPAPRR